MKRLFIFILVILAGHTGFAQFRFGVRLRDFRLFTSSFNAGKQTLMDYARQNRGSMGITLPQDVIDELFDNLDEYPTYKRNGYVFYYFGDRLLSSQTYETLEYHVVFMITDARTMRIEYYAVSVPSRAGAQ